MSHHCALCHRGGAHTVAQHLAALRFTADPTTLYLGDNGRCYCGAHLGASGRTTGHDLSGLPLLALDAATVRGAGYDPTTIVCEQPGCGRKVAS